MPKSKTDSATLGQMLGDAREVVAAQISVCRGMQKKVVCPDDPAWAQWITALDVKDLSLLQRNLAETVVRLTRSLADLVQAEKSYRALVKAELDSK